MIALVAYLAGCGSVNLIEKQASIQTSDVIDGGAVAVGNREVIEVDITAIRGRLDVLSVSVDFVGGQPFFEVAEPAFPIPLREDELHKLRIAYEPLSEGYHSAVVTIVDDQEDTDDAVFTIRARGQVPQAFVWPWLLDFGQVEVGTESVETVTVTNESALTISLNNVSVTNPAWEIVTETPVSIAPGAVGTLDIAFMPDIDVPEVGSVELRLGTVPLHSVTLRGNDCANGDPVAYDVDGDGMTSCAGDCDDDNAQVLPGKVEVQDGLDNDCDGLIDEGTPAGDADGDGYCEIGPCAEPQKLPGDCNDGAPEVYPGRTEIPGNGIDDNCDGVVDDGSPDLDGDGYTLQGGDCATNDASRYPDAPEVPDGLDNDCDGLVDEGTIRYDDDGDGYCDVEIGFGICSDGSLPGDCNDMPLYDGPRDNPAATEDLTDWRDNDCDGEIDEGSNHHDGDSDGYTPDGGDCDDDDPTISPAAYDEPGDGLDADCDPSTPA